MKIMHAIIDTYKKIKILLTDYFHYINHTYLSVIACNKLLVKIECYVHNYLKNFSKTVYYNSESYNLIRLYYLILLLIFLLVLFIVYYIANDFYDINIYKVEEFCNNVETDFSIDNYKSKYKLNKTKYNNIKTENINFNRENVNMHKDSVILNALKNSHLKQTIINHDLYDKKILELEARIKYHEKAYVKLIEDVNIIINDFNSKK